LGNTLAEQKLELDNSNTFNNPKSGGQDAINGKTKPSMKHEVGRRVEA